MICEPPVDSLTNLIGDKYKGSKFALSVVVAKHARQLMEMVNNDQNSNLIENQKPITAAAKDVFEGKIIVSDN